MAMSDRMDDQKQMDLNLLNPSQRRRLKMWEIEQQEKMENLTREDREKIEKAIKDRVDQYHAKYGVKK